MWSFCVFGLILAFNHAISALDSDGFDVRFHQIFLDPADKTVAPISLMYLIKKGSLGAPVFYGTAGRETVREIKAKYVLLDSQSVAYNNATVVYVEQRFFGSSFGGRVLTSLSTLAQLTLNNVLSDHISLIQELSTEFKTKNFLVFGGGHGGLIAGYVANQFEKSGNPNQYKILAWSSSAPLRYLKRSDNSVSSVSPINGINQQFLARATDRTGCLKADVLKLQKFFLDLKSITSVKTLAATRLTPVPTPSTAGKFSEDLQKLGIFFRNALLNIGFGDNPYDTNGKLQDTRYKSFCNWVKTYTPGILGSVTADTIDGLLNVIKSDKKVYWNPVDDGTGKWVKDLAAANYQDCTEYQIINCITSSDTDDPFKNSEVQNTQTCLNDDDYKKMLTAECNLLFKDSTAATVDINPPTSGAFPTSLNKNAIQTLNDGSVFSRQDFTTDQNKGNYAFSYKLWGFDQIEFDNSRSCNNLRLKQARYQIFRAFGCFGGFVDRSNDVCNAESLFDNSADNSPSKADTCAYDAKNFPWDLQPNVKFLNGPGTGSSSTVSTSHATFSTTPKNGSPAGSSEFSIFSASALIWFTALRLH